MSRTKHATRDEILNHEAPRPRRARTALTKDQHNFLRMHAAATTAPRNEGNHWRPGFNAGQRRRKDKAVSKVLGRRKERRIRNRAPLQ